MDIGAGQTRRVSLIVPEATARTGRGRSSTRCIRPGSRPTEWGRAVQRMLGRMARDFVIASPEYRQNYIAAKPPFVAEHPAILDAVARRVHVDAGRVYAFGYSKGGFGAWFVALYYPDRIAGAVAMAAGFDVAPADDGFWKLLVRNVAHVPVLNAWGERDPLAIQDLAEKPLATFAESNRRFEREVRGMGLPITNIEVPGARAQPARAARRGDRRDRHERAEGRSRPHRPRVPSPAPGVVLLARGADLGGRGVGRPLAAARAGAPASRRRRRWRGRSSRCWAGSPASATDRPSVSRGVTSATSSSGSASARSTGTVP